ncbi:MAG: dUTP diphosphatase [archaeon]|nr:dUTP diphosphatase [Nanoarchaeota archaeon]
MTIKVKRLSETARLPAYAREGDAGMDIYSNETVEILPGQRHAVKTGISMALPIGHVGLIWDKSGLAAKHGLKTIGGVIDEGYRGEVMVAVHNLSNEPYLVEAGKKIAQMLVQAIDQKQIIEVEELDDNTARGTGGFGSTGLD